MKDEEFIEAFEDGLTFGQQFNFKQLWRCKGHKGLYNVIGTPTSSGMVRIGGFLDVETVFIVRTDKLVCLDWYDFITTEPAERGGFKVLKMAQVFDNIFNYDGKGKVEELPIDELMNVLVPNYDEQQFKSYHAELVIEWYCNALEALTKVTEGHGND